MGKKQEDEILIYKQDIKLLHEMGYAQELSRSMGVFQNFTISFSIICVLSGGINSLGQATSGVGGAAVGIGWPVGVILSLFFALALAQISSAYPTAGGLYHWGSILGNRFTGWLSAWLNLLGLITVLGAINVGTFYFFLGAFGAILGMEDTLTIRVGFVTIITILQALLNHFGIRLTMRFTDFSGYLIFFGTILLMSVCLIFADSWDVSRLFTFKNYTGTEGASSVWPQSISMEKAFLVCLLLPVYTITGYDASVHTAEETKNAAKSVPKGMVTSVIWSGIFGYLMLCSFILMIPDLDEAAKQGWNVFFWAMGMKVPPNLLTFIYLIIFLSQLLCGLATVTSVSRMLFAFSRDDGIPFFSHLFGKVSPVWRTPVGAIWAGAIFSVLFVALTSAITISNTPVYSIVVSCTVIFLFLSFSIPIFLGLFAFGTQKWPKPGPWNMGGGLFRTISLLSLASMVIIFLAGIQPPNDWALPITLGFILGALVLWFLIEKNRFKGPPIGEEIKSRQTLIAQSETALQMNGQP